MLKDQKLIGDPFYEVTIEGHRKLDTIGLIAYPMTTNHRGSAHKVVRVWPDFPAPDPPTVFLEIDVGPAGNFGPIVDQVKKLALELPYIEQYGNLGHHINAYMLTNPTRDERLKSSESCGMTFPIQFLEVEVEPL